MAYGAEEFVFLIESWMRDARFHQLVRYGQERHWLSATGLRETNHSDILAWLLDPAEGHGLGDFFLRRLLVEATTADDNVDEVARLVNKDKWPGLADLFVDGLHGFQVGREVPCGSITIGKRTEKGFLDLLLLNRKRKLAVLIERKANRLAHPQQLEKYETWLSDHLRHYKVLRIVSDTGLVDQANARARRWLVVDDDWLLDGLKAAIGQKRASDLVCSRLADYLATVQWNEDSDPFYAGIESDLDIFAAEHSKEIKDLRSMRILNFPVRRLNVRILMGKLIPALSHRKIHEDNKLAIEQAGELASRYAPVIEAILDRSAYNTLEAEIEASRPDQLVFRQRRRRSGEQEMWITSIAYAEHERWPLVLEVRQVESVPDDPADESRRITQTRIRLRMHSKAFSEDDAESSAAAAAVLKVFKRRKTTHENVTLRSTLEDKEELTVKELSDWLADLTRSVDAASIATNIAGENE
jgi:hypothetical protein